MIVLGVNASLKKSQTNVDTFYDSILLMIATFALTFGQQFKY